MNKHSRLVVAVNHWKEAGGSASLPVTPEQVTAISNFHLRGDDAIVNGSNILTSWLERKGNANVNLQGTNIATIPALIDGHRAVSFNGTNQGLFFPARLFKSFYMVQRFFRHPTSGAWRVYHTSQSDANFTDTDFWRVNFPNNTHQLGQSGVNGGMGFNLSAVELAATDSAGVFTTHAFKNTLTTLYVNGILSTTGGFAHNQTMAGTTYSQLGYKAEGDNAGAFSYFKSDVLEIIGFADLVTDEQHELIMRYLNEQYPSISANLPSAPLNFTATPDDDTLALTTSIQLNWDAPVNNGGSPITGYKIERDSGSGFVVLVEDTESTDTEYLDDEVVPNTTYNYRISAINSIGSGTKVTDPATTVRLYTPFPTAPVFPDPTAITTTPSGKNIDNTALASKLDATMSPGQTVNISTTFTVGTEETPVRFKSLEPNNKTILGDGTLLNNPAFRGSTAGSSRHVRLYDFILYRNQGGISWPGNANDVNPATIEIQNVESHRHDFAGYWVNTANGYYGKINSNFYRYFHLNGGAADGIDGGEGLYIGHTTSSTRSKIYESKHKNLYGWGAARDGVQLTGIWDMEVSNATIRNSGTWGSGGTGQNRMLQDHSTWGVIRDSIFDGSPSAFEIQGTNKIMHNCLFKWMNTDRPFIGGFADGLGGGEPQWDDTPIIFDNCIFKTNLTGALFLVFLRACNVIVRNCIISNTVTSLYQDGRGASPPNSLIDGGGNVFLPNSEIPDPTYVIEPEFDLHLTYANDAAMIADQANQTAGRRYLAGSTYYTKKPTATANISDYIITLPAYVVEDAYYYGRRMGYRVPKHALQPTGISLSQSIVEEDKPINHVIGTFTALGGSGTYTFEVLDNGWRSDDYDAFNVASGNTLRTSEVFDLETKDEYTIRVRATSTQDPMRFIDQIITISVVPLAEVATDIVLSPSDVDENVDIDSIVGALSDDSVPGSTYTLVSGTGSTDNASFDIVGSNLIVKTALDFETKNSYAIRIRATNSADNSLTFEKQFTVTVNDLTEGIQAEYTAILDEATQESLIPLPGAGQQTKQNQVVADLKNAGVLTKLDKLWVLCAEGDGDFTFLDWISPTGAKITVTGTPVFTANSGWRANGNTHYLNSNFNFATDAVKYTQNDGSWTIGAVAPTNGTGTYLFGIMSGTDIGIGFRRFNSNVIYTMMNGAQHLSSHTFQNGDFAVFTANRVDSAGYTVYRNGASILTPVVASVALPNGNMPITAMRNSGGTIAGSMSSGVIKFIAIGASLTTDEITALNTIMTAYCNDPD